MPCIQFSFLGPKQGGEGESRTGRRAGTYSRAYFTWINRYFKHTCCISLITNSILASLVAQMVKNLPTMQETQVWSLGWEEPLEKGIATHSSIVPGDFLGQRSLEGYSPWGHKELDMTEWLTLFHLTLILFEPKFYIEIEELPWIYQYIYIGSQSRISYVQW